MSLVLVLTWACQPAPSTSSPSPTTTTILRETATSIPKPSATAPVTPPALPAPFASRYLNPLDAAYTYVGDPCTYLRNRWDPAKSPPGTVVMLVMLHSINRQRGEGPEALTANLFGRMMDDIHDQGFEAIDMAQLAGFLEDNAKIPSRSVVLIQDGRRYPDNFNTHFRQYWESWGWPVVNAWDAQGTTVESVWDGYVELAQEGMVDFQAYGPTFGPLADAPSDKYLTAQLQKPMDELQARLGKTPIGVVWPNGFSAQSARMARELGYRLGFTFNPRGPVMYNWVPLSAETDQRRPSYRPEASIGDPLMTLPRYWPNQVHTALDEVRIAGKEAAAYAEQNQDVEMRYYDASCAIQYGPIPSAQETLR
jgi:hypothetical protein